MARSDNWRINKSSLMAKMENKVNELYHKILETQSDETRLLELLNVVELEPLPEDDTSGHFDGELEGSHGCEAGMEGLHYRNLPRNNNCPIYCEYYGNDVDEDDDLFVEWCDLGTEFEWITVCPLLKDRITNGKVG